MDKLAREEPRIVAAAEGQMRTWVQTQEQANQAIQRRWAQCRATGVGPFLAVSRKRGAGGSQIAQEVGRRLGWEVLDQNVLDRVAVCCHLPRRMLDLVDETRGNWMFDVVGACIDRTLVPHEKYLVHLGHVIGEAARRGRVVFVGRGASFMLPCSGGLSVRIVAPESYRVEQVMRQRAVSAAQARAASAAWIRAERSSCIAISIATSTIRTSTTS